MTPGRSRLVQELADRVVALDLGHPIRLAIDGVDAAGKTTLANELVAPLYSRGRFVIRAGIDGFHYPRARRYQRGRTSPEGYFHDSFNLDALIGHLLLPLGPGGTCSIRRAVFDYRIDSPIDVLEEVAPTNAILVFDGVFLQRSELRAHWDATIYVDVPFVISVKRAAQRDGWPPSVDAPENRRYVEGQRIYMRECDPMAIASVVIDNSDLSAPTIRVLRAPLVAGA